MAIPAGGPLTVKISIKTAGSLVLSCLDMALCLAALLLGFCVQSR
jgi:hypothetical protein